jgi:hypothetical protein
VQGGEERELPPSRGLQARVLSGVSSRSSQCKGRGAHLNARNARLPAASLPCSCHSSALSVFRLLLPPPTTAPTLTQHTGKTLVPAGGSCVTSSGGYDLSKVCIASAPVCMNPGSGKCTTQAEAAGR